MIHKVHNIFKKTIDIIFPPQCLACRTLIQTDGGLCHTCWEHINFISAPQCDICGHPFELQAPDTAICGACMSSPPKYSKARAVLRYDDASARLITGFKYGDKTHAGGHFARWLARCGSKMIEDADIIAPVPLHKIRLFTRRYNQSAMLANSLGKITGRKICTDLLIRHKHTQPQAGLTYNKRVINVKSAFKLNNKYKNKISGKNILLIDDVMTTGSTIDACTRVLLKGGAAHVCVLTLATTTQN